MWSDFREEMGGLGLTLDGMSELYAECRQHVRDRSWNGFQRSLKVHGIYKECIPSKKWARVKQIFGGEDEKVIRFEVLPDPAADSGL